jgi:hypothetical protein
MKCPKCGQENASIIQEQEGGSEGNSTSEILCKWLICAPWALISLFNRTQTKTKNYLFCSNCGDKTEI